MKYSDGQWNPTVRARDNAGPAPRSLVLRSIPWLNKHMCKSCYQHTVNSRRCSRARGSDFIRHNCSNPSTHSLVKSACVYKHPCHSYAWDQEVYMDISTMPLKIAILCRKYQVFFSMPFKLSKALLKSCHPTPYNWTPPEYFGHQTQRIAPKPKCPDSHTTKPSA